MGPVVSPIQDVWSGEMSEPVTERGKPVVNPLPGLVGLVAFNR